MSNNIKSRIQMKNDTSANWQTAGDNGFIPLKGEIIFYKEQDGIGFKFTNMKIGDGVRTPNELPSYPDFQSYKEYVDTAISNAITIALNTEV